jgi:hypothetical protein
MTSESSRLLNSAYFDVLKEKKNFGRIMKYQVKLNQLFCWWLVSPAYVTFLKTG